MSGSDNLFEEEWFDSGFLIYVQWVVFKCCCVDIVLIFDYLMDGLFVRCGVVVTDKERVDGSKCNSVSSI